MPQWKRMYTIPARFPPHHTLDPDFIAFAKEFGFSEADHVPLTVEQEHVVRKKYTIAFQALMRELPDHVLGVDVVDIKKHLVEWNVAYYMGDHLYEMDTEFGNDDRPVTLYAGEKASTLNDIKELAAEKREALRKGFLFNLDELRPSVTTEDAPEHKDRDDRTLFHEAGDEIRDEVLIRGFKKWFRREC